MTNKSLELANKARQDNALDKVYRFENSRLSTFRKEIESEVFVGAEIGQVPSVEWNRIRYNRMNAEQQIEYDKKRSILRTEYRLKHKDGCFSIVPKMVYDYFINRK